MSLGPLIHGLLTSAVAVFMLSTSPFEFVIRHFFWLLLVVLCVGACNGLVLFPIIISMCGPEAELVPLEHPDRISTPSPVMSRCKRANKTVVVHGGRSSRSCSKSMHYHKDININDPSLTTITEEPPSWKSSSSSIQMNNEWNGANMNMNNAHYSTNSAPQQMNNYNMSNYYMHRQQPNYMQQHHHHQPPPTQQQCTQQSIYGAPTFHKSTHTAQQQQQQQHAHHQTQQQQQQQHPGAAPPPPPPTTSAHSTHTLGGPHETGNFPELQSIVVQPEVTVETHHSDTNTTKVTATANIKVELVTPGRAVRSYNFSS